LLADFTDALPEKDRIKPKLDNNMSARYDLQIGRGQTVLYIGIKN
jgi:hypothetical protein